MYSRILRCEILESDRWLDLPSDTHRLAYVGLLLHADDFGNLKGGPRRMFRALIRFTQIKTEGDSAKILGDLMDADLIRRYEADGDEFWHVPRFRDGRRYMRRIWPRSPWCDPDRLSTFEKNQQDRQKPAANLPQTSGKSAADLPLEVDVDVEVEVDVNKHTHTAKPPKKSISERKLIKSRAATPLPEGWTPSGVCAEGLKAEFGLSDKALAQYVAAFADKCKAKDYRYKDFDAAFRNAVREDWAGFRRPGRAPPGMTREQALAQAAAAKGMTARPGESWQEFEARIRG